MRCQSGFKMVRGEIHCTGHDRAFLLYGSSAFDHHACCSSWIFSCIAGLCNPCLIACWHVLQHRRYISQWHCPAGQAAPAS